MDIVGTGDYPLEWIFKNLDYYQKNYILFYALKKILACIIERCDHPKEQPLFYFV